MNTPSAKVDRRVVLAGIGATSTAAVLGACSGPKTGGDAANKSSNRANDYSDVKPAKSIKFWSVHPGASQDIEAKLVKEFNSSQSDTTVKLVTAGADYDAVTQKFQTAQQSHNLPGVVTLGFWINFYLNETITDLTGLISHVGVKGEDYYDAFWKSYTFKDGQWMVPYAASTPVLYYNKDHFRKVGLPDRGPKTWKEFAEWAPKLKQADLGTKHVFEFESATGEPSWTFEPIVWAWGGSYSDEFKPTMTSSKTVDAFNWGRNAIFNEKWAGVASTASAEDFGAGAVSAVVGSTGSLKGILKSAKGKFRVGTAMLPGGPETQKNLAPTGGAGLAIPSDISPEEQLAGMNFIKFLTNPDNTVRFSKATGYLPLRKSADTAALIKRNPQTKTAIDQLPNARHQEARRLIPGANKIINDAQTAVFTKKSSNVIEVMKDADRKLESAYKKNVKPDLPS